MGQIQNIRLLMIKRIFETSPKKDRKHDGPELRQNILQMHFSLSLFFPFNN